MNERFIVKKDIFMFMETCIFHETWVPLSAAIPAIPYYSNVDPSIFQF